MGARRGRHIPGGQNKIVRRALGTLLTTALVSTGIGVVATASPAAAADPVPTRIVPGSQPSVVEPSKTRTQPGAITYGTNLYVNVGVEALIDGVWQKVYDGPVSVTQTLASGASAVVAQNDNAYVYANVKAPGNATYTVNYAGGSGGYPVVTYAPTSAAFGITAQRKLEIKNVGKRTVLLQGKVSPAYRGKVTILKKAGKKWKKFKAVRTNKKGVFKTPLPAPNRGRFYWRVTIKKSAAFAATDSGAFYTYKRF